VGAIDRRRYIADVKAEWHKMWERRLEDDEIAEAIADKDYALLFVEKGLVLFASRACRPPRLEEILKAHGLRDTLVDSPPSIGGWGRFIRTTLSSQMPRRPKAAKPEAVDPRSSLQLKKGGRGWLHAGAV